MTPSDVAVVAARLDDLGEKLDAIHRSLGEDIREVKDLASKTNGRVRSLEEWRARVEGAIAGVSLAKPIVYTTIGLAIGMVAERLFGG